MRFSPIREVGRPLFRPHWPYAAVTTKLSASALSAGHRHYGLGALAPDCRSNLQYADEV